ncbi:MAG: NAD(P)-dependent oxidoreductase [Acidobacteria bacterium]|nr:MAG: NAD(P)-dependent oxidoreductase [Acidobacteriota bacterium]
MTVAFIGLGAMGLPMARNLAHAGHDVTVFNRTASRAEALAGGVTVAESIAEAAAEAAVVVTMLSDDAAVECVALGAPAEGGQVTDHLVASLGSGAVHISMSTISPALAHRLAYAHDAAGQSFVSAPVFGRPDAAEARRLTVVAAGPPEAIEKARPVLEALSAGIHVVGQQPWLANVVKLAGNFMLASMLEALGEAFAFARKSGVEAEALVPVIVKGLPGSAIIGAYGEAVARGRFEPAGFKLQLGLKDIRLVLEAADAAAVPMPLASLLRDHFIEASVRGDGDRDWSALASLAAQRAGLPDKSDL